MRSPKAAKQRCGRIRHADSELQRIEQLCDRAYQLIAATITVCVAANLENTEVNE
jgi:hypothetical protein